MSYGKPEKIDAKGRKYRRWLKRVMTKWRRLEWRRKGENAPKKDKHRGWMQ